MGNNEMKITNVFVRIGKHFSKEEEYLTEEEFKELGVNVFRKEVLGTKKCQFLFFRFELECKSGTKTFLINELADLFLRLGGVKSLEEGTTAIRQLYEKEIKSGLKLEIKSGLNLIYFTQLENKDGKEVCQILFHEENRYYDSPQDCGM